MDLLADENQHPIVIAHLRAAGHRVEWIRETMPGASDTSILDRPDIGSLIFLTYDRDFGDLIFNRGFPAPAAVLYTRMNRAEPELIADRMLAAIEGGLATSHMITLTKDGERSKPFPIGASHG